MGSVSTIKIFIILPDDGLPSIRMSVCLSVATFRFRAITRLPCTRSSRYFTCTLISIGGKTPIKSEFGQLKVKVTGGILFYNQFSNI